MNIAKLAIKRPVFIICIVTIMVILGILSYRKIGIDLMPDMTFPTVGVTTMYAGASPEEIEKLISKPLEDSLSSISGLKSISSQNEEGYSAINLEFEYGSDIDKATQDVRDKIELVKASLPSDLTSDPIVQKFDTTSGSVITLGLLSDLPPAEIYDLAKEKVKPQLEKIKDVGNVQILGGARREIQVEIDRNKLNEYRISMSGVVSQLRNSGSNIPIGSQEKGSKETVYRAIGEFTDLDQIRSTMISFSGDVGRSVTLNDLGIVRDGLEDTENIGYIYYNNDKTGKYEVKSCVYLSVIKQSGKNTVAVTDAIKKSLVNLNQYLAKQNGNSKLIITNDQSKWIRTNIDETISTIAIGIFLAVFVVFLFLGNMRSTIITAIAIPNSLLGAVILMNIMGYTFNLLTLMAFSLVVGLLVDDAIVVRENIFRKLEHGERPHKAAESGTTEVMLAVIATTLAVLSVFIPIGMISGVIGGMFRQFAFTIVFAMLISLFDALTVAPFLSAYFAKDGKKQDNIVIRSFEKLQLWMESIYEKIMKFALIHPLIIIMITIAVFFSSIILYSRVKATFFPMGDRGEFSINITMPPGTSLKGTQKVINEIEERVKQENDVDYYNVSIGSSTGDSAIGSIEIVLKSDRKKSTFQLQGELRPFLAKFAYANPSLDTFKHRSAPFVLVLSGADLKTVEKVSDQVLEKVKTVEGLIDVQSSLKKGKPEFRVNFDRKKMQNLGVSDSIASYELRNCVAGSLVGKYKVNGVEYDIRARLKPEQRDLKTTFNEIKVPNTRSIPVPLNMVAAGEDTTGFSKITRKDKAYTVEITANVGPNAAIGQAIGKIIGMIENEIKLPSDISYSFSGESQQFGETISSIAFAMILAIVFLYLILSTLYESFVTPFTILLAIPPALTGALFALVVTGYSLDMFSMVGMVMLIGIVTKNSILLVDNAVRGVQKGLDTKEAILQAGRRRLRPILMTTFAMIAGTLPLALGIGEAAKMRQSMGISILGGLIVSTLVTLIVVPAVFEYIDRFRLKTEARILVREKDEDEDTGETITRKIKNK